MKDLAHENHDFTRILEQDLSILAAVVVHRFASRATEAERIGRVQGLLSRAFELSRALELQTHYMLVDHRGSRGANDLAAATQALFESFHNYAATLRALGEDYAEFAGSHDFATNPAATLPG